MNIMDLAREKNKEEDKGLTEFDVITNHLLLLVKFLLHLSRVFSRL